MIYCGIISLGCSKNRVDTELMMGYLSAAGYGVTNIAEEADVLIVNTCGFIEPAKQESIDSILEMAQHKADKCSTLVVTGCLSQRYREELPKELPEVDIWLGVREYEKLPALLDERYGAQKCAYSPARVLSTPSHYAYLRIADGCDNRCSYCAIPGIRGRYRSRDFDEIVAEARELAVRGVKELIVIAQDTTRYGTDMYGGRKLGELLKELAKIEAIKWIRLLYTYPDDVEDELISAISSSEKILKYIDIPLQHSEDATLKSMNRRGSRENIRALVKKLKGAGFVLRTSFIVGFPGETKQDFEGLCSFVQECEFDRAGVFAYSKEEDTPAYDFPGEVSEEIAQDRREKLMELQRGISSKLLKTREGNIEEVVVDSFDAESGRYVCRSSAEAPEIDGCIFAASAEKLSIGGFYRVKITRTGDYDLMGEIVHEFGQ